MRDAEDGRFEGLLALRAVRSVLQARCGVVDDVNLVGDFGDVEMLVDDDAEQEHKGDNDGGEEAPRFHDVAADKLSVVLKRHFGDPDTRSVATATTIPARTM